MSYNDAKKVEDKIILLEQQVDKLTTMNEDYRRSEQNLNRENEVGMLGIFTPHWHPIKSDFFWETSTVKVFAKVKATPTDLGSVP